MSIMEIGSVANLVGELRQCQLLEPPQLDEVSQSLQRRYSDPRALAGQLMKQGWLTAYQVNQLFQGRGEELSLGPYVLLERLGDGGMGPVFKARHRRMRRLVSLVLIAEELLNQPGAQERFYSEVQAASQLSHAHIVAAFDAGPVGRTHFLAMEYVQGCDLDRLVRQVGALPSRTACTFIRQAALGLQHALERGLLHHDLRPNNLLVTPGPGVDETGPVESWALAPGACVKIRNMGLTLLRQPTRATRLDGPAPAVPITTAPDYLAPEQARTPFQADSRAELYSLGCTFYFLLTGQPPFPGGSPQEKLNRHMYEEPTPVETLRDDVPPAALAVLRQLLAKAPARRPQTPGEVAAVLESVIGTTHIVKASADAGITRRLPAIPAINVGATQERLAGLTRPVAGLLWRFRIPLLVVLFLGLSSLFLLLLFRRDGRSPAEVETASHEATARADFTKLLGELPAEPAQIRAKLLDFRMAHPGTTSAVDAGQLLMKQPSPLDALDEAQIPAAERLPWQPREALVAVLGEHNPPPINNWTMSVHPPTQQVMTRGNDNIVTIWNAVTGQMTATIKPGPVGLFAAAFSPDGKKAVVMLGDRSIRVVEFGGAEKVIAPGKMIFFNMAAAWGPDSKTLATTGAGDMGIKIWDVSGPAVKELGTIPPANGQVLALAFSPDGKTLAASGVDRKIRTYEVPSGKELNTFAQTGAAASSLLFAPSGEVLVALGQDQAFRVMDVASGKERTVLRKTGFAPNSMTFLQDGKVLAVAGGETTPVYKPNLMFWDMATGAEKLLFKRLPGSINAQLLIMGLSPDGKTLTTWSQDQTLRTWDVPTGQERGVVKGHSTRLTALDIAPTCDVLATGSIDGSVKLWDAGTVKVRGTLHGHTLGVTAVTFSPDGKTLASAGHDGTVRLWDVATRTERSQLAASKSSVLAVAYAPDGKTLATGSDDGFVKIWEVSGGQALVSLDGAAGAVQAVAFSADGRFVAGGCADGSVRLWATGPGRSRTDLHGNGGPVRALAFSGDGTALMSGSMADPNLRLWRSTGTSYRQAQALPGHTGPVLSAAASCDGRRLASAGEDGNVFIWKADGSDKLHKWLFGGAVPEVVFAADGRHIGTINANGTAYILRLSPPPKR